MPPAPAATCVTALVSALSKLPGIGPRSAERLALHVVQTDAGFVKQLAEALVAARERIQSCQNCGGLTEEQPCAICADPRRDPKAQRFEKLGYLEVLSRDLKVMDASAISLARVLRGSLSPLITASPSRA